MVEWTDYISDVQANEDGQQLDRICIMEVTRQRWIATDNSLRPTAEQLQELLSVFHKKQSRNICVDQIKLGSGKVRTFHIRENDGTVLEGIGGKLGNMNEILCVARTRQFVILAGHSVQGDNGRCREEVDFLKTHDIFHQ